MKLFAKIYVLIVIVHFMIVFPVGCGGGGGNGNGNDNAQTGTQSDMARFYFDCDLQGLTGQLVMDVEVISASGITWGPGPDPDITGVIGTGDYTIYTEGGLDSPTSSYIFTGENQFADFTEVNTSERFRVQWVDAPGGITMIVNPFGPLPTQHFCVQTDSERI
jgi:hypothetical protein